MSTVLLSAGAEANLSRRADVPDHGAGDDVVRLLFETVNRNYNIYTFAGADTVDTLKSNVKNQNAALLGAGNDTFIGGAASDTVYDGSGTDKINLGNGTDLIRVSAGNDTYDGGAGSDYVSFAFSTYDGSGLSALNQSAITCDLALKSRQDFGEFGKDIILNFENLEGGNGNDILFGTTANNSLYGNRGDDKLYGRSGNDRLNGGYGNDTLIGGPGKDVLNGAEGVDRMYCGINDKARDIVRYAGATESPAGLETRDLIFGFHSGTAATDDRIDLSVFSDAPAQAGFGKLKFVGSNTFSLPGGEVRVVVQGEDTLVQVDLNGTRAAEMNFLIIGVTDVSAVDFIL